ncbi:MAG: polyketide antibiotic transporter [Kocuria sp.]|nr:polyketide antibiotic transporter [Kocuria sp.]
MTRELQGTGTLLRLALKRDQIRLPIWVAAIGFLLAGGGQELAQVFSSAEERQVRATIMSQPSGIFMGGPGYGLDNYTVGAMMANEYTLFIVVAVAIMALQTAVRHTRGEESAGRIELLRSTRVGRHAAPAAATLMLIVIAALIALVSAGSMFTLDLPAQDSWAFGAGVGAQVLVFGAVGLLCAQLSSSPRGAVGLGLAVLGVAVVVRGVGDIMEPRGSWLSWFSPIAWSMQTRAFVDLRWWPLMLAGGIALLITLAAMTLQSRRDLDAGLLPQRSGRAHAAGHLRGPLSLGFRLTRTSNLTWLIALILLAVTYGSLAPAMRDSFADLPAAYQTLLGGSDQAVQGYLDLAMTTMACGAAALAVALASRLRGEETDARTELTLSLPIARLRWLLSWWVLSFVISSVVLLLSTLVLAAITDAVISVAAIYSGLLLAWATYLPALALFSSIAVLLYALSPRFTVLAWVPVLFVLVVAIMGSLLNLPMWLANLSPFQHVARLASDSPADVAALTLVSSAALVATTLAVAAFRHRDIPTD